MFCPETEKWCVAFDWKKNPHQLQRNLLVWCLVYSAMDSTSLPLIPHAPPTPQKRRQKNSPCAHGVITLIWLCIATMLMTMIIATTNRTTTMQCDSTKWRPPSRVLQKRPVKSVYHRILTKQCALCYNQLFSGATIRFSRVLVATALCLFYWIPMFFPSHLHGYCQSAFCDLLLVYLNWSENTGHPYIFFGTSVYLKDIVSLLCF